MNKQINWNILILYCVAIFITAALILLIFIPLETLENSPDISIVRRLGLPWSPTFGLTRAIWSIMHGQIALALKYNKFVFILFPFIIYQYFRLLYTCLNTKLFAIKVPILRTFMPNYKYKNSRQNIFMLKSNDLQKTSQGNISKYLSYREAWTRIKQAQEQEFYLEAVTLEESIINDRLISYLIGVGAIERANELHQYPSFSKLIKKWKLLHTDTICVRVKTVELQDLQTLVDNWRERRNKVVHSIVKSYPGTATCDILVFLEEAKLTAQEGEILARAVSYWVARRK